MKSEDKSISGHCSIDKLIEHLSQDVTTVTSNQYTFRHRLGFTVLLGPFVMMSSVLIATGGNLAPLEPNMTTVVASILAVAGYIALAYYGSKIDAHTHDQCNVWRRAILKVSLGKPVTESDIEYTHGVTKAWVWAYSITLITFVASSVVLLQLLPPPPE